MDSRVPPGYPTFRSGVEQTGQLAGVSANGSARHAASPHEQKDREERKQLKVSANRA
jgi:hypothetical protein